MLPNRESKLRLYSLGIVVKDKQEGSDQIVVYPVEELPTVLDTISSATANNKVSLPDSTGAIKSSNSTSQSTLVATWIPFGESNRITAPDVVQNETVIIFRYADTALYYWTTIFREPTLRRQETVYYMYSNLPDGMTAFDVNSSYWVLFDTKNKKVQVHTSNNDTEAAGYDFTIDTANGDVSLTDTLGNSIELESVPGKLTANINTEIDVNTKTVNINAATEVNITTPTININANTSATIITETATVTASGSVNINSPTTNMSGNLNVAGDINFGASMSGGGMTVSAGNVTAPSFTGFLNGNISGTYGV